MSNRLHLRMRGSNRWLRDNCRKEKRRWPYSNHRTFISGRRVCFVCKASVKFRGILNADERGFKRISAGGCRGRRWAAGVVVDGDVGREPDGAVLSADCRASQKGEAGREVY